MREIFETVINGVRQVLAAIILGATLILALPFWLLNKFKLTRSLATSVGVCAMRMIRDAWYIAGISDDEECFQMLEQAIEKFKAS